MKAAIRPALPAIPAVAIVLACVVTSWLVWPDPVFSHGSVTTTVLFDREIVRVLNGHCVMCHTEGGPSFPISTYEQTWLQRLPLRTAVLRRHMPPWSAVAGYGLFANDNSLTLREEQFVISWVEGLGPRNAGGVFLNVSDPQARPRQEVRAVAHVGHWMLGQPDLTRMLPPNRVDAGQGDVVRRTVVDLGLTAPTRIRALEYLPDNRRAVRAAVFSVQATGQWLGSWTPWYGFVTLPDGVMYRLPAGTRIVADVHYRQQQEPFTDAGTLGLFVANASAHTSPTDLVLDARSAAAAGATKLTLKAVTRLTSATSVWALRPDIVPDLLSIEVSARKPDGGTEILLFARTPSPDWPTPYILKTPLRLPSGTQLSLVAHVDAAAKLPPSTVRLTVSRF